LDTWHPVIGFAQQLLKLAAKVRGGFATDRRKQRVHVRFGIPRLCGGARQEVIVCKLCTVLARRAVGVERR
jgi:hypothetical protein